MLLPAQRMTVGGAAVLNRFAALAPLVPEELALLQACLAHPEQDKPNREIIAEDSDFEASRFLLSGWACRARTLSDGRRQIIDFYLPGDILGYCSHRFPPDAR